MKLNVPAGFVLGACHWRELAVDTDETLEWPLGLRAHHFGFYVGEYPWSRKCVYVYE